jgi:hypothetical protein
VIDVREESSFGTPALNLFRYYPPILPPEIERAASLAAGHEQLVTNSPAGGAWRIFRALTVYAEARTGRQLLDGCISIAAASTA